MSCAIPQIRFRALPQTKFTVHIFSRSARVALTTLEEAIIAVIVPALEWLSDGSKLQKRTPRST